MNIYDLTGQEVSKTYYRVVQVISGSLYDGLGNAIALNVSGTVDYNNILNVPSGIISGSNQLPSGLISSSTQLPSGLISSSNGFISSSAQISTEISGAFTSISSSLAAGKLDKLNNNVYSSSNQLPPNLLSSSIQISTDISGAFNSISSSISTDKLNVIGSNVYSSSIQLPSGIISSSTQLPSGLISSSVGILIGSNVYSSSNQLPSGLISSSNGFLSSSAQISTDISGAFTTISSSLASDKLNRIGDSVYSSSTQLPNGIISSSTQLPNGLISSSAGFISSSNQISNEISGAFTSASASIASEKLNKVGSNVYSSSVQLPTGIISSSNQLPSGIISSSTQLPSGIISSSNGFISASSQIASDISGSIGNFSSSVATQLNTINTKLTDSFGIVIAGGNSVLTTGSKNISRMKNDGILIAYQMDSYVIGSVTPLTGSIEIDVQRNGVTMGTASMSATASILNTTLTEWHTTLNKYDEMRYSVKSNSEIKNITLTLFYNIN